MAIGTPEKKTSPYLYAVIVGCVVALPVVMFLGYLLDLSAGDEGQIQLFELLTNRDDILSEASVSGMFGYLLKGGMTAKATVIGFFASLILIVYVMMGDGKRFHRKGVEHGSARWGKKAEKDIIADTNDFYNNIICASDVMLVLDRKKREKNEAEAQGQNKKDNKPQKKKPKAEPEKISHDTNIKVSVKDIVSQSKEAQKIKPMLNLNQLILGGSGTGKSRFFVKPNLLMCNTSYCCSDPSGELAQACGQMLMNHGYKIKIFNLNDMKHSSNYNPFHYLKDHNGEVNPNNVIKMINVFMMNTKQEGASGGDQFWDDATRLLLSSLSFLLIETGTEEEQNFAGVLDLIHKAKVVEGKEEEKSELDLIFDQRKEAAPKALSVQYYEEFKQAAGKTMQSILISTTTKLQYFKLPDVRNLTATDNIHLEEIGDEKTALFIVIPSSDTTYNFLAAMMYTQLFDTLYDRAINLYKGRLPVHVRFVLDEFANIGKIPEIDKILATCRKFEISIQIILQNLSQLKKMYKEGWEEFGGNCDTMIYLGGKDQFTNEYISKELGKETIDQQSINQTKGKPIVGTNNFGNVEINSDLTAEELLAYIALYKSMETLNPSDPDEEIILNITSDDIMKFFEETEYISITTTITHDNTCDNQNCKRRMTGDSSNPQWEYYCDHDHDKLSGQINDCLSEDDLRAKVMELTDSENNGVDEDTFKKLIDEYIKLIKKELDIDEGDFRESFTVIHQNIQRQARNLGVFSVNFFVLKGSNST